MVDIEVKDLRKHYGSVPALQGLSFSLKAQQTVGFLGPNGAGKTTTMRILSGLARPSSGSVQIVGVDVQRNPAQVRQQIGYLAQQPAFYNWMTGWEFLLYVADTFAIPRAEAASRAEQLLRRLEIWDARRRAIGVYSGGMKQRLGIAQALINRPRLLLLDEPVSALDPIGRHEILQLIGELGQSTGVFMSSHVLADVERVCDYVIIVNRGQVAVQSSIKELKERYATPTFVVSLDEDCDLPAIFAGEGWFEQARREGEDWRIAVSDVPAAKVRIPSLLLAAQHTFRRFQQLAPDLEDIFLKVVDGE